MMKSSVNRSPGRPKDTALPRALSGQPRIRRKSVRAFGLDTPRKGGYPRSRRGFVRKKSGTTKQRDRIVIPKPWRLPWDTL